LRKLVSTKRKMIWAHPLGMDMKSTNTIPGG